MVGLKANKWKILNYKGCHSPCYGISVKDQLMVVQLDPKLKMQGTSPEIPRFNRMKRCPSLFLSSPINLLSHELHLAPTSLTTSIPPADCRCSTRPPPHHRTTTSPSSKIQ